jgi:hypothetical protein
MITPEQAGELAALHGIKVYTILAGTGQDLGWGFRRPVDDTRLRHIADVTGGRTFRATNRATLEEVYAEIDELERTRTEEHRYVQWGELSAPWLLVAFAALGRPDVARRDVAEEDPMTGLTFDNLLAAPAVGRAARRTGGVYTAPGGGRAAAAFRDGALAAAAHAAGRLDALAGAAGAGGDAGADGARGGVGRAALGPRSQDDPPQHRRAGRAGRIALDARPKTSRRTASSGPSSPSATTCCPRSVATASASSPSPARANPPAR